MTDSAKKNQKHIALIEKALAQNQRLEMVYLDMKGVQSRRVIEPVQIKEGKSLHLMAYCTLKEGFRSFRLSQIHSLSLTKRLFSPLFLLPSYEEELVQSFNPNRYYDVLIYVSHQQNLLFYEHFSLLLHYDEHFTGTFSLFDILPNGDTLFFIEQVQITRSFFLALLSFGHQIQLAEPLFLQPLLERKAKDLLFLH